MNPCRAMMICVIGGLFLSTARAAEIAGVDIPERAEIAGTPLVLNGAGIRSKFFIKVYVGAMYLPHRSHRVSEIIGMQGPKRAELYFLHDEVSRNKLVDAWNEGFENNLRTEELERLHPRIKQFNALFQSVHRGDVITLDYLPELGTSVILNGAELGKVPGADFNQALLKIWLGDDPADKDLKRKMLGD